MSAWAGPREIYLFMQQTFTRCPSLSAVNANPLSLGCRPCPGLAERRYLLPWPQEAFPLGWAHLAGRRGWGGGGAGYGYPGAWR